MIKVLGNVNFKAVQSMVNHTNLQVKDSIALNFMIEVLNVVKTEKGSASVLNLLKKSGMDAMLTELFPTNKRSSDNMKNHFVSAGLPEIVTYLSSIENAGAKKVNWC